MNEEIPAHDLLSPSAADRWIACPASLVESVGRDRPDTQYTIAGTRAHELAAAAVLNLMSRTGNKITYDDDEQQAAVEQYVGYIEKEVLRFAAEGYRLVEYRVEQRVRSRDIADFGGTIDFYAIWQSEHHNVIGHIVDFKSGQGVPVDAAYNYQLIAYAALLSETYPVVDEWRCAIVQPRCQVDGATVRESGVEPLDVELFRSIAREAKNLTHVYQTGEHCRWCPAKAFCKPFYDQVVETARLEMFEPEDRDFGAALERWLFLLKHEDALRAMLTEVNGRVLRAMEQGRHVPGWKAVPSKGHRRWIVDEALVLRKLRSVCGVPRKEATETSLRSPAQIEKILKSRKADTSVLERWTERPDRGCRVVPDANVSDPASSVAEQLKEFETNG